MAFYMNPRWKQTRVYLALNQEIITKITKAAFVENKSRAYFIRSAVEYYLAQKHPEVKPNENK